MAISISIVVFSIQFYSYEDHFNEEDKYEKAYKNYSLDFSNKCARNC